MPEISLADYMKRQPNNIIFPWLVEDRAVVFGKTDRRTRDSIVTPVCSAFEVEAGLYETGSTIRMKLELIGKSGVHARFEEYLNPKDQDNIEILEQLGRQETVEIYFYDHGNEEYARQVIIPFRESYRAAIPRCIRAARVHNSKLAEVNHNATTYIMMVQKPLEEW